MASEVEQGKGRVLAISISEKRGTKKQNVNNVTINSLGIDGDAHAGDWDRQVSFLDFSSVSKMQGKGMDIGPGDFAENITTENFSFENSKIGDIIVIGDGVRVAITKKGKTCHDRCEIYNTVGDCVMPKEGVFAKVLSGGAIKVGDEVSWE